MSVSDKDGATTDIASFFRSPDLYACSCAMRYGSICAAMFGASGVFESPSSPWHAWHIRAFVRPALTSPALPTLPPAKTRQTDANRCTAESAALGFAEIILNPQGSCAMDGMMAPRQGPSS